MFKLFELAIYVESRDVMCLTMGIPTRYLFQQGNMMIYWCFAFVFVILFSSKPMCQSWEWDMDGYRSFPRNVSKYG